MNRSNCLVIAGEKSGEDHFMSLHSELQAQGSDINFWGVGGDEMKELGVELVYHLKDFSSWGYTEVLTKIPFYLKALNKIEELCIENKTEYALLIDFQEFNLRLAARLQARGVIVLYYVAPQAWAWKSWRAAKLQRAVDHLFVLMNFEKPWFEKRGCQNVHWVAHPLYRTYQSYFSKIEKKELSASSMKKILLLPGSRTSELKYLLPEFRQAMELLKKEYRVSVSMVRARHLPQGLYESARDYVDTWYTDDQLAQALLESDCCLAASGTVTLTCALFRVPTVVVYKASLFNEFLFQTFVNYSGAISLANLIHKKPVFPELLQEQASGYLMADKLKCWLEDERELQLLMDRLGETKVLIQGDLNYPGEFIGSIIKKNPLH